MKKFVPVLAVVLIFFIFVSCSKQEEPKETSEVQAEVYDVAGMVVSLDSENNTITIAHEDIPGFMSAMTMGFHVKDSTLLEGVQPEDSIQFELTVSEGEMWVSAIQKLE
jgi:protein SCO1/2